MKKSSTKKRYTLHVKRSTLHDHDGSALLVAMIIMGILMTIAIGVSEIVIQSVHDSRQLIDRTTAWYRAESGIETALDKITQNAPGFEVSGNPNSTTDKYDYAIVAAANVVPVPPYMNAPPAETYSELPLGQTVNIPLFSAAKNEEGARGVGAASGSTEETPGGSEFKLQYYLNTDLLIKNGVQKADVDIVRWKIFGINKTTKANEVINGLIPENPVDLDGEQHVSCLGTANETNCYSRGKYYTQDSATREITKDEDKPIDDFLNNHTQNFLAITNMTLEKQLEERRVNGKLVGGFTFTRRGWSPVGGLEIDDGFNTLRNLLDERDWSCLYKEIVYFRRQLQQNPASYSVTAFGPISLVVE